MIHLDRGRPPSTRYPFVKIKPQGLAFCVFTCPPSEIGSKDIHWLGRLGTTVPCQGDLCRYCGEIELRRIWYAPVFEWYYPTGFAVGDQPWRLGGWRKAILRITAHMDDILRHDLTGKVVQVSRHGKHKNSPLTWRMLEDCPERLKVLFQPFDVEPTMNLVWGALAKNIKIVRPQDVDDGGELDESAQVQADAPDEGGAL